MGSVGQRVQNFSYKVNFRDLLYSILKFSKSVDLRYSHYTYKKIFLLYEVIYVLISLIVVIIAQCYTYQNIMLYIKCV